MLEFFVFRYHADRKLNKKIEVSHRRDCEVVVYAVLFSSIEQNLLEQRDGHIRCADLHTAVHDACRDDACLARLLLRRRGEGVERDRARAKLGDHDEQVLG